MTKHPERRRELVVVSPRMIKAGAAVLANRGDLDDNALVAAIYRSMVNEAARLDSRRALLPSHMAGSRNEAMDRGK